MTDKVYVYHSQPLFWANQLLVICLPLPHTEAICKRSSYCPTDIWNYAIWFEFLYVKVKLPVTPFLWWQVLYLDQHNYSLADVDIGVTRSLEPLCNDNLMIQVVAEGLLYAFGSLTASDVIGPLRMWRHGYFPVSSSFPLAVYFNVQSKSVLHCYLLCLRIRWLFATDQVEEKSTENFQGYVDLSTTSVSHTTPLNPPTPVALCGSDLHCDAVCRRRSLN